MNCAVQVTASLVRPIARPKNGRHFTAILFHVALCAGLLQRSQPSSPGIRRHFLSRSTCGGPGPCCLRTIKDRETGPASSHDHGRCRHLPALGKPAMEFVDRVLKCSDCGAEFVFTAGEQLFFHDKQFKNDPKHCKQCKAKRASGGRVRAETRTTCSACGTETTVPFKPTQGRPVLCRACFQKQQQGKLPPVVSPKPSSPTAG